MPKQSPSLIAFTRTDSTCVLQLATEADGVDVVLLTSVQLPASVTGSVVVHAWSGHPVVVVPPFTGAAGLVLNVSLAFDAAGRLLPNTSLAASVVELDCSVPDHGATLERLFELKAEMRTLLGETIGHLNSSLQAGTAVEGDCVHLPNGSACGCYVAECGVGNLVADGVRWAASTDVAIINGGSIRANFAEGPVERGHVLQALPFLNEVQKFIVSGQTLEAALRHGLANLAEADAISAPDGRFLQLSGLRVEWRIDEGAVTMLRAEVIADDGTRSALQPSATYSLATGAYLANGGDGFDLVAPGVGVTGLGKTVHDAVSEYLGAFAASSPGLHVHVGDRTIQMPELLWLRLGLLCGPGQGIQPKPWPKFLTPALTLPLVLALPFPLSYPSPTSTLPLILQGGFPGREECDHAHHMAAAINDKSDGFLDDLLPYAHILLNETEAGCNRLERTRSGLNALQSWDSELVAAVGPGCSGDLAELASAEVRAERAYDTVFISSSSTADALSNATAYPHVVRLSSPEKMVMAALAAFVERNGWQRVALLHDDSLWGVDSGAAFSAAFVDGRPGRKLVTMWNEEGATGARVPLADCRGSDEAGTIAASEWLDRLERVDARIIVLAMAPVWAVP